MNDIKNLLEITDIQSQLQFPQFLTDVGLLGIGIEVGVQAGVFSRELLSKWKGEKLYMVDSWRQINGYRDEANVDHNSHLNNMAHAFMKTYEFDERAVLIRDYSISASKLFQDNSLDFVFIDADHSYAGCMDDLCNWYPKVKSGGIFCGHDYMDYVAGDTDFGVKSAVDQFAKEHNLEIHSTIEARMPDGTPTGMWMVRV